MKSGRSSTTCIPFSLFKRSLDLERERSGRVWRFRKSALESVQRHTERHIASLFQRAAVLAKEDGRVTVQLGDMEAAASSS